jgi:ketosteroid isomerase-like protein
MEDEIMSETSPFGPLIKQWVTAANSGDAAGLAALYTTDAVGVFTEGIFNGVNAIIEDLGGKFQQGWSKINLTDNQDHLQQANPQPGNWAWSVGTWSSTFGKTNPGGFWSALWVLQPGNVWKIQQQTVVQSSS